MTMDLTALTPVSSKRAAQIVGIGYEGFRTYLKRDILGQWLPKKGGFHSGDGPMMFGFAHMCLIRVAKLLIDQGLSFDDANRIVSRRELYPTVGYGEFRWLTTRRPYRIIAMSVDLDIESVIAPGGHPVILAVCLTSIHNHVINAMR